MLRGHLNGGDPEAVCCRMSKDVRKTGMPITDICNNEIDCTKLGNYDCKITPRLQVYTDHLVLYTR